MFLLGGNRAVWRCWYVKLISSAASEAATEWGLVVFMEGGRPRQNCSPGCSGMRLTGRDLSGGNWGNPHWAGCKGFPAVETDSKTKIMLHSVPQPHKSLLDQIISVCTTFRDMILGCKAHFWKSCFCGDSELHQVYWHNMHWKRQALKSFQPHSSALLNNISCSSFSPGTSQDLDEIYSRDWHDETYTTLKIKYNVWTLSVWRKCGAWVSLTVIEYRTRRTRVKSCTCVCFTFCLNSTETHSLPIVKVTAFVMERSLRYA